MSLLYKKVVFYSRSLSSCSSWWNWNYRSMGGNSHFGFWTTKDTKDTKKKQINGF